MFSLRKHRAMHVTNVTSKSLLDKKNRCQVVWCSKGFHNRLAHCLEREGGHFEYLLT
jgi:hypothetical protein